MDPTLLAINTWKEILDSTKPQQGIFWNYIFLRFLWWKEMLKFNEVVRAESENSYEIKKLEWKITQQQIIEALQRTDWYIEYQNLFSTIQKTLPKIQQWIPDKEIDPDKIKRLKDLSKEFSSDYMQEMIAWILAWEYNNPWSYSIKTMDVLKSLSKDDLELLRKFWWFIINNDFIFWNFQQLSNKNHALLFEKWVWWNEFLYLQELWIFSSSTNTSQKIWDNSWIKYQYTFLISKMEVLLTLKKEINLGNQATLTRAWKEIFKLIDPVYDKELFQITLDELISLWFESNISS